MIKRLFLTALFLIAGLSFASYEAFARWTRYASAELYSLSERPTGKYIDMYISEHSDGTDSYMYELGDVEFYDDYTYNGMSVSWNEGIDKTRIENTFKRLNPKAYKNSDYILIHAESEDGKSELYFIDIYLTKKVYHLVNGRLKATYIMH